jgi:hypothetical protein
MKIFKNFANKYYFAILTELIFYIKKKEINLRF